jgi:cytochrome c
LEVTFLTKSILALILVGMAIINLVAMLELLGRTGEKKFDPKRLRQIHRVVGYSVLLLFLVISYFCVTLLRGMGGEELSARVALHGYVAVATFFLLAVKIFIVRYYKKFYSIAVSMGFGVFILILMTAAMSAGYYFTVRGISTFQIGEVPEGLARQGAALFNEQGCADCHFVDRTETKVGPGLKGIFKRDTLPISGLPVSEATIRRQLTSPFRAMPSYASRLSDDQIKALIAFLKAL